MKVVRARYSTIIIRDGEMLSSGEFYIDVTSQLRWLTHEHSTYVTVDGVVIEACQSEFETPCQEG